MTRLYRLTTEVTPSITELANPDVYKRQTLLKELIVQLENQKAELLGLTPAETAPPPPTAPERPTLTAVPATQPAIPVVPPLSLIHI